MADILGLQNQWGMPPKMWQLDNWNLIENCCTRNDEMRSGTWPGCLSLILLSYVQLFHFFAPPKRGDKTPNPLHRQTRLWWFNSIVLTGVTIY